MTGVMKEKRNPLPRWLRQGERLRTRFPGNGIHHPTLVDKDFDHITSDRRAHLERRTFYLGEIFWASGAAFGRMSGGQDAADAEALLPTLVTRRQDRPGAPVELAPPGRRRRGNEGDPAVFVPQTRGGDLRADTVFLLLYRRPVPRDRLGSHLDTLHATDKQRLSGQLDSLRRSLA